MRIIHFCLTGGYTEEVNYQENYLTKYHALAGNEVTIITTQYCWDKNNWSICYESDYINKYGVRVIRIPYLLNLPYKINTYIGRFKGLREQLKKSNPDIIFIHNLQFQDIAKIAKYKRNNSSIHIFVDNHTDFSNSARKWVSKNILYGLYWKRIANSIEPYVERFYGVLPARVDFLHKVYGITKSKIELLVMGSDDEAVQNALLPEVKLNFRKKYKINENDFLIVTGGKIDVFKTQTLLLMEAMKNINDEKVKLIIFGSIENSLKEKFLSMCDDIKIQYIGWVNGDDSYNVFIAADLVVFPGRHSVYWEQVAGLGIPMLCKYWEGTTHIDLGGNAEFLYKDSADEIYEKIMGLLYSKEKYCNMKNVALEKGMEVFSYKRIAEKALKDK